MMRLVLNAVAVYAALTLSASYAEDVKGTLTVKPSRCIALQQGQNCFATLNFRWTTPESGDYCLFDERELEPLVCWAGAELTTFKQSFESDKSVTYEIRFKDDNQLVATARVKVSWVYRSNNSSTSRWRLF